MHASEVEKMTTNEEFREECRLREKEGGEMFRAQLERLMQEKGVSSIEELHRRFLETGWRIPIPGRHADKPVKLEEFKLHCRRAWPSPEKPRCYVHFIRGLCEALDLTEKERRKLLWYYYFAGVFEEPPEEYFDELPKA